MFGSHLANFQEGLPVFGLYQRFHHEGAGLVLLGRCAGKFFGLSPALRGPAARCHRDIGQERALVLVIVGTSESDVGAFPGAHNVAIRKNIRKSAVDFTNEIGMEIFPQVTDFDIRVHPRKRRLHGAAPSDKHKGGLTHPPFYRSSSEMPGTTALSLLATARRCNHTTPATAQGIAV